jgi:hypothetical protein
LFASVDLPKKKKGKNAAAQLVFRSLQPIQFLVSFVLLKITDPNLSMFCRALKSLWLGAVKLAHLAATLG